MKIQATATIPAIQSAICIGGAKGEAIRLKLDLYLTPDQIATLYSMQGESIAVAFVTDDPKIDGDGMYDPNGAA
jgi:hypothetical protein